LNQVTLEQLEPLNLKSNFFKEEDLEKLPLGDRLCVKRFRKWLESRKVWYVVLECEDVVSTRYYMRDFRFFRVYNRFDKECVKKVVREFSVLSLFAEDHSFVHIILTVEGGSISDNIALLREAEIGSGRC